MSETVPDHETLTAAVRAELETAAGRPGDTLSEARAALTEAYLGNELGGDAERRAEGWSTYVDRSVLEAVEWAKPGLLRVFASCDEIVRFDPSRPGQERQAAEATDYVNRVVFGPGAFGLIHDVITDALLQRVAWAKVRPDEERIVTGTEYAGLSREEACALLLREGVDNVELSREGELFTAVVRPPRGGLCVRVEAVPSERVLWNNDARDMETCRFVAQWEDRTLAELEAQGFDPAPLETLAGETGDGTPRPEAEARSGVTSASGAGDASGRDGKMRRVRVFEAYILMPRKGGGEERFKVLFAGEEAEVILSVEPWRMPRPPLFPVSSVPLPHQVGGLCLADLVLDIQRLRTELSRQLLDSLALSNQGEFVVKRRSMSDVIDMDQFLARRIAGVYEVTGEVDIFPLPSDSRAAQEAAAALKFTEALKESRTGVGQTMRGLQADALQNTATGALILEDAVNQRLELIARVLAENFFKPVARYVLLLVARHGDGPLRARLAGRFCNWNPAEWDPDMDVSVSVGLGTGNRSRQSEGLQLILSAQRELFAGLKEHSPVQLPHIMHTLHTLAQGMGFASPEQFFGSMEDARRLAASMARSMARTMANKPEAGNPEREKLRLETEKAGASLRLQQAKAQAELELARAKARADLALQQARARDEMALAREKALGESALGAKKIQVKQALESEKLRGELALDQAKMLLTGRAAPGTTRLRQADV